MDKKTPREIFEEGLRVLFNEAANLPDDRKQPLIAAGRSMAGAFHEVERAAMVDFLTGLPSRAAFMLALHTKIEDMGERAAGHLAVIFIDLDGFKEVNDTLGHAGGDTALRDAAACLKTALAQGDIVGRLGGDEFGILMHTEDGKGFSEDKIKAVVRESLKPLVYWQGDQPVPVCASIGISFLKQEDSTQAEAAEIADSLLKLADKKMYEDKAGSAMRLGRALGDALTARNTPKCVRRTMS